MSKRKPIQITETVKEIGRWLIRYTDKRVYDFGVFASNHETVCEICINRSCSKAEILLRRTDRFGPVCFIYAFFSPISKAETLKKEDIASDEQLFSVLK